ncbi:hypothetical protein M5K25_008989 [Dendrobium thyrsiflorum]|uniref:Uncharacterized protein n=1 Tax=Dendrobium thyrsiflorum TaxID=117978 RepID=A0ABD0VAQ8_DENTH
MRAVSRTCVLGDQTSEGEERRKQSRASGSSRVRLRHIEVWGVRAKQRPSACKPGAKPSTKEDRTDEYEICRFSGEIAGCHDVDWTRLLMTSWSALLLPQLSRPSLPLFYLLHLAPPWFLAMPLEFA